MTVQTKTPLQQRLFADFLLLVICAIWGSTFFMVDQAVETMNVLVFIAYRFSIALVVLLFIFGYRLLTIKIHWKDVLRGALIGLFLFAGYTFQTFGMDLGTGPGKASFITGLYVVLVPIFASLMLKKRPHFLSWIVIVIAVVGLGLLSLDNLAEFQFSAILGDLLVVICTFAYAFHIIFIDKYVEKSHYIVLTVIQTAAVAILAWITCGIMSFFPSIFNVPVFPIVISNQVIFALFFTGIIATALILGFQTYAQKKTSPTHVAVIFSTEPVFGALFAIIFAGEYLLPRQWVGCALILVSMIFQQLIDIYFKPKEIIAPIESEEIGH